MLRSADWQLVTDVSGQPVAPIVKEHAVNSLSTHVKFHVAVFERREAQKDIINMYNKANSSINARR